MSDDDMPQFVRLETDDAVVDIYTTDEAVLNEARHRGVPLTGPYSAIDHKPHVPTDKRHLQVYAKNNWLFSLNTDGSGREGSTGTRIPSSVAKAIRAKFPDYKVPDDRVIESYGSGSATMKLTKVLVEMELEQMRSLKKEGDT